MRSRGRLHFGWLSVLALGVAVGGISVAAFVYGPSTATTRGIDPIEYVTPAFSYRLWTVAASVGIALILLVVDALRRLGEDE